jgi:5'-phosphate synthase pdxT subunit
MSSLESDSVVIGVLALQGDYAAHIAALEEAGAKVREVRSGSDLRKVNAMVIPGGESTVMGSLLIRFGFMDEFRNRILSGMPVFGTCAGLILLAKDLEGKPQPGLGVLDVLVRRNAYGTQVDSFRAPLATSIPACPSLEGVFIRAPKIVRAGAGVEILARQGEDPVLVRQGNIVAASFHPELIAGAGIHRWFLGVVQGSL